MDFFKTIEISASGLSAQRTRLNVAASNLANASTTDDGTGAPYQRRDVVVSATPADTGAPGMHGDAGGVFAVKVDAILADASPPRLEYDPGHPDADADGYVAYPNVNVIEEMVDMITASRAYEAGVTALDSAVSMAERALSIGA